MEADSSPPALARRMKAAQDAAGQVEPITAQWPAFDVATAYTTARLLHQLRVADGARAAGRKIGFTNSGMWARYGVAEPIWGYLYDATVVRAAGGDIECSLGRLAEPKIEPEIVFGLGATPAAGADASSLLGCIEWVAHGFEIVQSHFPGWKFEAPDAIADGSLHGLLLLGEPQPVERLGDSLAAALETFAVTLSRDGQAVETGSGANVLGSPLAALAHLLAVLAGQPQSEPLRAGEMVTTGTLTAAHPVQPGERWQSSLSGIALPGLAVRFTE